MNMAPNKLENQFREKLNNREINPSEAAWDRLDAMLSVTEKPKRKRNWLFVAASILGFLFVGTIIFNQKEKPINTKNNNVVIENKTEKVNSKTEIKSIKTESDFSKINLKQETKPLVQTQKNTKSNAENQMLKTQKEVVAEIQPNNQKELIVANINSNPENMDSLLASVEKNSQSDSKKSSVKVNSTNLLNQVDGELQLSFREKALNTITQKYKEAKEALVNRNNQ
jgi:uncharacterized protein YqfB (UPF0267 family)